MASTLVSGPENDLGEWMSAASQALTAAGWNVGIEWALWEELIAHRYSGPTGLVLGAGVREWLPRLEELRYSAGGWVWWLDGMKFVPADRWAELVKLRRGYLDDDGYGAPDNSTLDEIQSLVDLGLVVARHRRDGR